MERIPTTLTLTTMGLFILAAIGCHDAPQKNPFDPVSGGSKTLEGNFVIESQEDLDALIEQGGRAFEIAGSLTMQEPAFTTLEGLKNLTRVGGDLIIDNTGNTGDVDFLTSLRGLDNLTEVGGSLYIHNQSGLTSLDGLQNLRQIGSELIISGTPSLLTTADMSSLLSVGDDIYVQYAPLLQDVLCLKNIKIARGSLFIGEGFAGGPEGTGLSTLTGLDSLEQVLDDLAITGLPRLESLAGLSNLTQVGGNTVFAQLPVRSLAGLEALSEIGGSLTFGNENLENLNGLNNLTRIGGDLRLNRNPALQTLNGLDNLASVGGMIDITANHSLTDLSGFRSLTHLPEDFLIHGNDALVEIGNLGLTTVNGRLSVRANDALQGLNNLSRVGNLRIEGNASLTIVEGLNNLIGIERDLFILRNPALLNLNGVENLRVVGEDLSIRDNIALSNLDGLGNLATLGGNLAIRDNTALSEAAALALADRLVEGGYEGEITIEKNGSE